MNVDKGVSLSWVSSEKGNRVLADVLEQTDYYEVKLKEAVRHNSSAVKSVNMHKNRDKFFEKFNNAEVDIISLIEKYHDSRDLRKRLSQKLRIKIKKFLNIK